MKDCLLKVQSPKRTSSVSRLSSTERAFADLRQTRDFSSLIEHSHVQNATASRSEKHRRIFDNFATELGIKDLNGKCSLFAVNFNLIRFERLVFNTCFCGE